MRWILSPSRTTLLSLVALLITVTMLPAARADDRMVLQVYDVRDLLHSPPDFPAPRLGLGGLEAPVAIPDDDDDEREGGRWTVDELVELIRKMVSPASWGAAGARITAAEGVLVVLQQPQACRQVGRLLDDLRGRATELFQVDTRVVALPPPCIEELGFRQSKPRLSLTMAREIAEERLGGLLEAKKGCVSLSAPSVTTFEGQVASVSIVEQTAYVQDIRLDEAMAVADPVIGSLAEGLVLELRVSRRPLAGRLLVDWSATVARAQRPFPELAGPAGTKLELPEVEKITREGRAMLAQGEAILVRGLPALDRADGREVVLLLAPRRLDPQASPRSR